MIANQTAHATSIPSATHTSARRGVAYGALAVAVTAFGGAIGLGTGSLALAGDLQRRLPFSSPVVGALALGAIVGLPFLVLFTFAARGDRRTDGAAVFAGALLVGWIAVEYAFIRAFSAFQVVYLAVGIAFVAAGRVAASRRTHTR